MATTAGNLGAGVPFHTGPVTRASVRRERPIACPAEEVWAVVGDPSRLGEWWPGLTDVTVDGAMRTIVTGAGLTMPETILTVDPIARRFQYRLDTPMFTEHLSTIDVHALGDDACLVVYSIDADPAIMAIVIAGAAWQGLQRLDDMLGAATKGAR